MKFPKVSDLRRVVHPRNAQNMQLVGIDGTLANVKSSKDKDRVIIYLNENLNKLIADVNRLHNEIKQKTKDPEILRLFGDEHP